MQAVGGTIRRMIDYFVPQSMLDEQEASNLTMVRTFILLHLGGPLMGHSVILFLWHASAVVGWQFWSIEAAVLAFFAMSPLVRITGGLTIPAAASAQLLVFVSLFGSYFYGGISSPFLPWMLIALLIGFFYVADHVAFTLAGVAAQLALFSVARVHLGDFPELLPLASLKAANLVSVVSALAYITLMSLYYESVMRDSAELEVAAREQRHRAASLRKAMEDAEQASRQKSIFLAKMSHELRTPLNAVIGYSEMLRDDVEDDDAGDPQRAEDLNRINAAGRHLLSLVNDVLDLSSIERQQEELCTQLIDLNQLVSEVVATARPLVGKKENRLVLQVPKDLGLVEVDALKLRQCMLNLLSNAAKFTTHGTIMLAVARQTVASGPRLTIEVSDSGIGIAPDALENIFTDYGQAEASTARMYGGTGLGLALARRFARLMDGDVGVESTVGVGSVFTIDIAARFVGGEHSLLGGEAMAA